MTASASTSGPVSPVRSDDPAILVRGLRRRYSGERRGPMRPGRSSPGSFEAVRGVDLEVGRGELLALLGTNGAGKTSTLEVIEGLSPATAGQVRVLGLDPFADRARVRPRIGILLQEGGFPGALTVDEMATFWRSTLPRPRPVAEVLELVVLSHRAGASIDSLSGGERRRLDLALALLGRPEVLFLDEPTTGLDPQSRRATWDLVRTLLDEHTTVLLTTHYLEEAEELADRIAIMHEGRIATTGTLHEIVSQQPTRITFTVDHGPDLAALRESFGAGLSEETRAGRTGVRIETFDSRSALSTLLGCVDDTSPLADLKVLPGSLEQAFLDVASAPTAALATPAPTLEGASA